MMILRVLVVKWNEMESFERLILFYIVYSAFGRKV